MRASRVLLPLASPFDRNNGAVTIDDEFRNPGSTVPGSSMSDIAWPHGFHGTGLPHGAVFSR